MSNQKARKEPLPRRAEVTCSLPLSAPVAWRMDSDYVLVVVHGCPYVQVPIDPARYDLVALDFALDDHYYLPYEPVKHFWSEATL